MHDLLEVSQSPSLFSDPRTSSVYSFFGKDKPKLGKRVSFGEKVAQQIAEETAVEIRRGTRVRHPSLGEGSVLVVKGSGDMEKYVVFFDQGGKRKLLARHATWRCVTPTPPATPTRRMSYRRSQRLRPGEC